MKSISRIALMLGLVGLMMSTAFPVRAANGLISAIKTKTWGGTNGDGLSMITISGTLDPKASCASSQGVYVLDLGKASGRATHALAMAAYLAGKPVNVLGVGSCLADGDGAETLGYAWF